LSASYPQKPPFEARALSKRDTISGKTISWGTATLMTLIIAAAQSTSIAGEIASNVVHHLRFGTIAAEHGAQLLVFPELSLTGYEPGVARLNAVCPEALVLDSLRCLAEGAHMTVVAGAPMLNDRDELYIAALAIRPDGSTLIYTKEYLHPGEEQTWVLKNSIFLKTAEIWGIGNV